MSLMTGYVLMFIIVITAKLGQAMYHPAGATIAGNIHDGRRSTLIALFVAFGWVGFGSSQLVFSYTYEALNSHTEWLLIPGGVIFIWALGWCKPIETRMKLEQGFWIPYGISRFFKSGCMCCLPCWP